MLRHHASDERQQVPKIPGVERANAGDARLPEFENCEAAARAQDAGDLGERPVRLSYVPDAKPDRGGIAGRVGKRNVRRVAAHQANGAVHAAAANLREPQPQHLSREIHPDDRGAVARRTVAIARSAVPVQRSSTRAFGPSASASTAWSRHRRSSPALSTWFNRS